MSRWLQRALADIGTPASVPIAPLAPIGPPAQAIGTIGTNGTGPAMAEDWQAHYDERAAIRQFDGELPKWEAEALAFNETTAALGPRPTALSLCPEAEAADDAKLGHALVCLFSGTRMLRRRWA